MRRDWIRRLRNRNHSPGFCPHSAAAPDQKRLGVFDVLDVLFVYALGFGIASVVVCLEALTVRVALTSTLWRLQ